MKNDRKFIKDIGNTGKRCKISFSSTLTEKILEYIRKRLIHVVRKRNNTMENVSKQ